MAEKKYVKNPKTNRDILVDGAAYKKLVDEGVVFREELTNEEIGTQREEPRQGVVHDPEEDK